MKNNVREMFMVQNNVKAREVETSMFLNENVVDCDSSMVDSVIEKFANILKEKGREDLAQTVLSNKCRRSTQGNINNEQLAQIILSSKCMINNR